MKVGLVGCGYWGRNYLKTLRKRSDVQLSWVCNPNIDVSSELPRDCKFTYNYQDILNMPFIFTIYPFLFMI